MRVADCLLDGASEALVKLSVIALDYDGTIAQDGVLDSSVRDAIANARRQGIIVTAGHGKDPR